MNVFCWTHKCVVHRAPSTDVKLFCDLLYCWNYSQQNSIVSDRRCTFTVYVLLKVNLFSIFCPSHLHTHQYWFLFSPQEISSTVFVFVWWLLRKRGTGMAVTWLTWWWAVWSVQETNWPSASASNTKPSPARKQLHGSLQELSAQRVSDRKNTHKRPNMRTPQGVLCDS